MKKFIIILLCMVAFSSCDTDDATSREVDTITQRTYMVEGVDIIIQPLTGTTCGRIHYDRIDYYTTTDMEVGGVNSTFSADPVDNANCALIGTTTRRNHPGGLKYSLNTWY